MESRVKVVTGVSVDIPRIDLDSVVVPIPIILLEDGKTSCFEEMTN